jgi:hypothetical protein
MMMMMLLLLSLASKNDLPAENNIAGLKLLSNAAFADFFGDGAVRIRERELVLR